MSTAGRPAGRIFDLMSCCASLSLSFALPDALREQTLIHFCLRAPATELAAIAFFAAARPWQNTSVLRQRWVLMTNCMWRNR